MSSTDVFSPTETGLSLLRYLIRKGPQQCSESTLLGEPLLVDFDSEMENLMDGALL